VVASSCIREACLHPVKKKDNAYKILLSTRTDGLLGDIAVKLVCVRKGWLETDFEGLERLLKLSLFSRNVASDIDSYRWLGVIIVAIEVRKI
jgi:hypothetical protein